RRARADRARLRRVRAAPGRDAGGGASGARGVPRRQRDRDQAPPGAPARRDRAARLRPNRPASHDPSGSHRGMSVQAAHWSEALAEHGVDGATVRHLVVQLSACEVAALAFCRLLERWARGEPDPCTPGRRQAALRRAADRAETAIAGLDRPLGRYLLELEPEQAEGRWWYGEPGAAELIDWEPVLTRAGVHAASALVAQTYLELAVLVRALQGLSAATALESTPDRSSLWAGLFDLR